MSDKPISVGDLVVVVRDCCGKYIGRTFIVEQMATGEAECVFCRARFHNVTVAGDASVASLRDNGNLGILTWLRRIPPLEELEGVKTEEPAHVG